MAEEWFDGYGGESTRELLSLAHRFRIDSLVLAMEEGLQRQAMSRVLSREEQFVLAIEALEREVNNGGFAQFFLNSSNEFVGVVGEALATIGCTETAAITRDAITALGIPEEVTSHLAEAAVAEAAKEVAEELLRCDERYFDTGEPIADRLFQWIATDPDMIRLGASSSPDPS